MRIDRAIVPPGLIRNGSAYTLFSTDRGLFAIRTGRGWRLSFEARGRLNSYFAKRAVDRIKRDLTRAEQSLNEDDLEAELQRRKGSLFIQRSELTDLELRADRLPELRLRASGKQPRFEFEEHRADEVAAFVATLRS